MWTSPLLWFQFADTTLFNNPIDAGESTLFIAQSPREGPSSLVRIDARPHQTRSSGTREISQFIYVTETSRQKILRSSTKASQSFGFTDSAIRSNGFL